MTLLVQSLAHYNPLKNTRRSSLQSLDPKTPGRKPCSITKRDLNSFNFLPAVYKQKNCNWETHPWTYFLIIFRFFCKIHFHFLDFFFFFVPKKKWMWAWCNNRRNDITKDFTDSPAPDRAFQEFGSWKLSIGVFELCGTSDWRIWQLYFL